MKIIFLVENTQNLTASGLLHALNQTEHDVEVVPYFSGGVNHCSIIESDGVPSLTCNNTIYSPADYDAAVLWCWGTAFIGRKYLRLFEDQGVAVLNSTYDTEITDSKIGITRMLESNGVATPKTLFFDNDYPAETLSTISAVLGAPPYVFKSDYSTQGHGIQFASVERDVETFAKTLRQQNPDNHGFILQEFIGNPDVPIFHYRVLVLGDDVFPFVLKVTASSTLKVSNIASGGLSEIVPMTAALKDASLLAAQSSGLKIAGVDLMMNHKKAEQQVVVLEINDGPGTKTFDQHGHDASGAVIHYLLEGLGCNM